MIKNKKKYYKIKFIRLEKLWILNAKIVIIFKLDILMIIVVKNVKLPLLNNIINQYMQGINLGDIALRDDVKNIIFLRENKNVSHNQRQEK